MKVAALSNLFPTDRAPSAGVFVRHRAEAYRELGVDCTVLALKVRPPAWVRALRGSSIAERVAGFTPVDVRVNSVDAVRIGRLSSFPFHAVDRAVSAVLGVLRPQDYDVLVAHGMFGVPAGAVAQGVAAAHGKPWVPVLHGSDVNTMMPRFSTEYAGVLNAADGVIFVSSALEEQARGLGFMGRRTRVIPNGVDLDVFDWRRRASARRALEIDEAARVLAFVGNLNEVKGADWLPAISRELANRANDVQLLVAGDGPLLNALRHEPRIRMLGRLAPERVADVMAAADVLVMPSRSEGWPCVIFEALASGTSVVATEVGGVPEALAGGGGRLVCQDDDLPRTMVGAALEALASGNPPQEELRNLADGYDWTSTARAELDFLQGVLNSWK